MTAVKKSRKVVTKTGHATIAGRSRIKPEVAARKVEREVKAHIKRLGDANNREIAESAGIAARHFVLHRRVTAELALVIDAVVALVVDLDAMTQADRETAAGKLRGHVSEWLLDMLGDV